MFQALRLNCQVQKKELSKNSDELRTTSVKGLPLLSEERQQKGKGKSLSVFVAKERRE